MLHIVNRSPFTSTALTECLKIIQPNDTLLLIEDAVIAATGKLGQQLECQQDKFRIVVLMNDILARGLTHKVAALPKIDYSDFVVLTEQHQSSITWS